MFWSYFGMLLLGKTQKKRVRDFPPTAPDVPPPPPWIMETIHNNSSLQTAHLLWKWRKTIHTNMTLAQNLRIHT